MRNLPSRLVHVIDHDRGVIAPEAFGLRRRPAGQAKCFCRAVGVLQGDLLATVIELDDGALKNLQAFVGYAIALKRVACSLRANSVAKPRTSSQSVYS